MATTKKTAKKPPRKKSGIDRAILTPDEQRAFVRKIDRWPARRINQEILVLTAQNDQVLLGVDPKKGKDTDVKKIVDLNLWKIGALNAKHQEWELRDQLAARTDPPPKPQNGHGPEAGSGPGSTGPDVVARFYAYLPEHKYLCEPTGALWPASSVNARFDRIDGAKASDWLDTHRTVEQMTWMPGVAQLIRDRVVSGGGWRNEPGYTCYNLYRPPEVEPGDPSAAAPWIDHVQFLYGSEAGHIIKWLAQRIQQPGVKINHALVLGGEQGIGKDTLLEPVRYAIGAWNFSEITPVALLGRFNKFVRSVILRISEARDLGDMNRYAFYEHSKMYVAAPPEVLPVDEKNVAEYYIPNVCGVIITSNHKTDGIYLPAEDRRHFVAWSERTLDEIGPDYWTDLYTWFENGGNRHVAAYLQTLDLSGFDPKAPPPKTPAFWDIVNANRAPEDAELADVLDKMGNPQAVTLTQIKDHSALP